MPGEFSTEAVVMLTSGAIVAGVALPLGLLGWALRSRTEPLLPPWKPWRVPWGGFEVLGSFIVVMFAIPLMVVVSTQPPKVAVGVIALPIQLAFLAVTAIAIYPRWKPRVSLSGVLPLAAVVWLLLTPTVLALHAGIIQLFTALNLERDEHPLANFVPESLRDQVLYLLQACVAAPLTEEILFRGILLTWVMGVRERAPGQVPAALRPWFVMGFALLFSATGGKVGPVVFASVLAAGLAVVWVTVRRGKRHVRAVYASAAMFAMVHSSVWPTPIPLFLLGLGLGWCAVRTRGVLVPAVVHGLFNAVSAVFVLRGSSG